MLLQTALFHSFFVSLSHSAVLVCRRTGGSSETGCGEAVSVTVTVSLGAQDSTSHTAEQVSFSWMTGVTEPRKICKGLCFAEVSGCVCIQEAPGQISEFPQVFGNPGLADVGSSLAHPGAPLDNSQSLFPLSSPLRLLTAPTSQH